jgi:sporulation protein YlmC with PRC-barrel domain
MSNVQDISSIIGRPVLSVESANRLGHVHDLIVDPLQGELAGLSIQRLDQSYVLVDNHEIHSIGPDAVMVDDEESLALPEQSTIKAFPQAKNELIGVKVITESGHLLGKIANLFMHPAETPVHAAEKPVFIYEVRSSIIDKLLGHAFFFPASLGCAFSADRTSLVVSNDTQRAEHSLETVVERIFGHSEIASYEPGTPAVTVRSHSQ